MLPESNATNANFTRSEQYTVESLVGANLDVMEMVDFLTAVLFGWESHMYCAKKTVSVQN